MNGVFCKRDVTHGLGRGPASVERRLKELLNGSRVVCLNQVHSDTIVRAEDVAQGEFPRADGIISHDCDIVLCVRTADCVPILMWSDDSPMIAAVHAGWRGLAKGIVFKAVQEMRSGGACRIHVSLGPSIGPCCYEVGDEVIEALQAEPSTTLDGRISVDLHLSAALQAQDAHVAPEMIYSLQVCTCCNQDSFFSYRRDGEQTGRNISLIGGQACSLPGLQAR